MVYKTIPGLLKNHDVVWIEMAGEAFKVKHDGGSEKRLRMWLDGIVQRAEAKTKGITETLTLMGQVDLPKPDALRLIEKALPLPNTPRRK